MPRAVVTVSQSSVCVCVCVCMCVCLWICTQQSFTILRKVFVCKVHDHDNPFQASVTFNSFFTYSQNLLLIILQAFLDSKGVQSHLTLATSLKLVLVTIK